MRRYYDTLGVLILLLVISRVDGYNVQSSSGTTNCFPTIQTKATRRGFLLGTGAVGSMAAGLLWLPKQAYSAMNNRVQPTKQETQQQDEFLYMGAGCFWHLQHSLAVFERDVLGRKGSTLTSQTGYAGGVASEKVCYHNSESDNEFDYAQLGHGEVVHVQVPSDRILQVFNVFLQNFNATTHDRRDPMDLGPEYRSILGMPGGLNDNPLAKQLSRQARNAGFLLVPGKGSDPDTLGTRKIYVYDTQQFPFYQAEIYHQFHNDFQSLPYGPQYNNLARRAYQDGRLHATGCPDRALPTPGV